MRARGEIDIDTLMGRPCGAVVEAAARRPRWTLLAALVLAALSMVYVVRNLGVNGDSDTLFDASLPFRKLRLEFENAFPELKDRVLVVVEAKSATRARDVARRLAADLETHPDEIKSIWLPGDGPYFEQHGLLYLETAELEELVDQLAVAQPFLAELSRDRSLRGFFGLLAHALEAAPESTGFDLSRTFVLVQQAVQAANRLRARPVSFDELTLGKNGGTGTRRYLMVQPQQDYEDFVPGRVGMELLLERVAALKADPSLSDVTLGVTGELALQYEELDSVKRQALFSLGLSYVLVTIVLFLGLRSPWAVIGTQLTLTLGLIYTAAFAALAVGHLNVISVAFAVMFVGLGVDFGIHICLRYMELRGEGHDHFPALRDTGWSTGTSLVICAVTTAIGFYAFTPTRYDGVSELGLIAGTGMFLSLFATLTILPAWLSLRKRDRERVPRAGFDISFAIPRTQRHPRLVLAIALAVGVVSAIVASRWHFDPNPLHVRDPNNPSVIAFQELLAKGDVNPWTAELLAADVDAAERDAARLRRLPEVGRVVTLASYVPEDQEEKLAILADASLMLNLGAADQLPPPTPEENLAAVERFQRAVEAWAARSSGGAAGAAGALGGELERFLASLRERTDPKQKLASLEESLVAPTLARIDELVVALGAGPVTVADLPLEIRSRMVTSDGRARVEVFPKGDLNRNEDLLAFTTAVAGVAPQATGSSMYMVESAKLITGSLMEAFTYAVVAMLALLLALWRSILDTLLVFIPLGMAALVTAALAHVMGLPLNFADVIVLPLLLGIGIDTGIHLVHRYRHSPDADLLSTATSRGVIWASATTIDSFGTMGLASHRGLATLGQLLALGVAVTLVSTLVLIPALLAVTSRRREAQPLVVEQSTHEPT
jgi:hopanoid biosynthesis associated RND transporter like protein HpnN